MLSLGCDVVVSKSQGPVSTLGFRFRLESVFAIKLTRVSPCIAWLTLDQTPCS